MKTIWNLQRIQMARLKERSKSGMTHLMMQWHEVKAVGELTVHGVSIQRSIPSKIQWDGDSWQIQSKFSIATAAHDIPIPKMVRNKIAEEIAVEVNLSLSPR